MSEFCPKFGNLEGLHAVCVGGALAAPFAAMLLADNGAEVFQIESTVVPDIIRGYKYEYAQLHRNVRDCALNIPSPEGKEIFLRMMKWADVLIESSKGGTFDKWGLSDEALWEVNPKLVIVHVSGYGQSGDPKYVARAAYDFTGQAFSGYPLYNGNPDQPPMNAKPMVCDHITGLTAAYGALMGVFRAQRTGKGESVDVAQYEAMLNVQYFYPVLGFMFGQEVQRSEGMDSITCGRQYYKSKDGKYVSIHMGGKGPLSRGLPIIGLGDDPDFVGVQSVKHGQQSEEVCAKYIAAIDKFASEHTAEEIDEILNSNGVPCARAMTFADMMTNSHYKAREDIIEYHCPSIDETITGFSAFPKFKQAPQQVWRGGPTYGMDNEFLLGMLGYSEDEISGFYESGIIKKEI